MDRHDICMGTDHLKLSIEIGEAHLPHKRVPACLHAAPRNLMRLAFAKIIFRGAQDALLVLLDKMALGQPLRGEPSSEYTWP